MNEPLHISEVVLHENYSRRRLVNRAIMVCLMPVIDPGFSPVAAPETRLLRRYNRFHRTAVTTLLLLFGPASDKPLFISGLPDHWREGFDNTGHALMTATTQTRFVLLSQT